MASKTWISVSLEPIADTAAETVARFKSSGFKGDLEVAAGAFIQNWLADKGFPFVVTNVDHVDMLSFGGLHANGQKMIEDARNAGAVALRAEAGKATLEPAATSPELMKALDTLLKTPTKKQPSRHDLRTAYLFVFDHFAVATSDVMKHLGKSRSDTLDLLNKLERAGLIGGDYNESKGVRTSDRKARPGRPGSEKIWRANETYDSSSSLEPIERFDVAFPEVK